MVLYHAVSSYQLLEVMLHRMIYHEKEKAVLLLPDFITEKYPQYRKLEERHFFDKVCLFPYLNISHREEKLIQEDVNWYYHHKVPYPIGRFSKIYVAGAHFYFSLYLIRNQVPFTFLEDAAGMLSHPEKLEEPLEKTYPVHARIAEKYGLFDASNPLIEAVVCLKRAQTIDVSDERYQDFSVEEALSGLSVWKRRKIIRFFMGKRLTGTADAILLTQHFANLGMMSEEEQRTSYERLRERAPEGIRLLIKKHPDDTMDYEEIFPGAAVIRETFPSELLPYVFRDKPETIYTLDSTGCENLREHFTIEKFGRERYAR